MQGFFFFLLFFPRRTLGWGYSRVHLFWTVWVPPFLANALRGRVGSQSKTFMEHLLDLYGVYILESQSLYQHWGYKSEHEALRNLIQALFTD